MRSKTIKCPWCGKKVATTRKGGVPQHLTPGERQCQGVGVGAAELKVLGR